MSDAVREHDDDEELSLRDVLEAVRRRRGAMLATGLCALAVTLGLVFGLPPKYRSTGTILIEQQELPSDLVRSTVTSYADQRIQVISQRVMTTETMLDLIRKYDLYPADRDRETREELLERMRDDIDFQMISADVVDPRNGVPQKATIAFSVSYASRYPDSAYKVANDLTTLYLNENLTSRTRLAQDASGFLAAEGERLKQEVAKLDERLATFKKEHADALPELSEVNLQMLQRAEEDLRQAESRLAVLDQQRVFLSAQLAMARPNGVIFSETGERILSASDRLKASRSQLAAAIGVYGEEHPDIQRIRRQIASLEADVERGPGGRRNDLERRLEDARSRLAADRERYSAEHPDIRRGEAQIAALEAELAALPAAAAGPASGGASDGDDAATGTAAGVAAGARPGAGRDGPDNPTYVQLQTQLKTTEIDRAAVVAQIAETRGRVRGYERNLASSPEVEREYRELLREMQNAQLKYQELRSKQMEAKVSENLESDRKGERFTLIEPPLPPQKPESPNRPLIFGIGVVLSLLLSVGAVALLESIDATVRGSRDLVRLATAPLLAIVPRILSEQELLERRRRRQFALAGAVASVLLAAVLLHFLVRPLDSLWFTALRRLGV